MIKTAARILRRLGLAEKTRVMTDEDRRKIRSMLDAGMSGSTIARTFEYSPEEITESRKADFLTGKLPPAP